MKKISVITINFNNQEGLSKTVKSVLNQSFKDIEFLVIDGGSTDESKTIIENNKCIDYWVSEKDSGVYSAMNKGVVASSGEYIIFMNSGDVFYDDYVLEKNHASLNDADIIYGDAIFCAKEKRFKVVYPDELFFSFFYSDSLCHQSTFYKREIFDENLYNENFKIVSDWEFNMLNVCLKHKTYKHISEIICYYDLNGISMNQQDISLAERDIVLDTHFKSFIRDYELLSEYKPRIYKRFHFLQKKTVPKKVLKLVIKFFFVFYKKRVKL